MRARDDTASATSVTGWSLNEQIWYPFGGNGVVVATHAKGRWIGILFQHTGRIDFVRADLLSPRRPQS